MADMAARWTLGVTIWLHPWLAQLSGLDVSVPLTPRPGDPQSDSRVHAEL